MKLDLGPNPKIAFVSRGGPENGPFSAMAARILSETLSDNNYKVSGIYTSSGSTPTALMGCVGDYAKLCDVWANIKPENIVGKTHKLNTILRIIRKESILASNTLGNLIQSNWNLDAIFSPSAIPIKFPAVDLLSSEYIIFSNKKPGHKKWFLKGVLGSMGLIPFLQPQMIYDPVEAGLIDASKVRGNSLLLVDGGFKGNMLLEEAVRDQFDIIFLIDIHGLKPTETDINMKYHWTSLTRSAFHLLSNTNDIRQFQITDRINEEIRIKDKLLCLLDKLPTEFQPDLLQIINCMDEDRLRLGDKRKAKIYQVSNEEYSTLFNFVKFTQKEVLQLLTAGYTGAIRTLESISS